jgi:phenylalanyl-tRNA synthetase alpha chain
MFEKINELEIEIKKALSDSKELEQVEKVRIDFLGKKGKLTSMLKSLGSLELEDRKKAGALLNKIKNSSLEQINKLKSELASNMQNEKMKGEWVDISMTNSNEKLGHIHPISQMRYEIVDYFKSMGFMIADGPWIEDEHHNFEALNIPKDHPARDMQDTFWLEGGRLLRTHTSCVQIRVMEKFKPPIRAIAPGRVFRYESTDASHENTFNQVEGLMVDKGISVAHLIYTMRSLLSHVFKKDVKVRLRPGYFPFVEPGFELDFECLFCGGKGCSVCKQTGWVELMPCGLVHPNVLKYGNIDPNEYSGFASRQSFAVQLNSATFNKSASSA